MTIYSDSQLSRIDLKKIPKHIAIIPDGNRRWAKNERFSIKQGHTKGADNTITIVKAAKEIGIKVITFYTFSTENWLRPKTEISSLMWLIRKYLADQCQTMVDNGIQLHTLGKLDQLPRKVQQTINQTKQATKDCKSIDMILAINYGGRDEIIRAVQLLLKESNQNTIDPTMVDEVEFSKYLDTASWPDPELLIRTSGEMRISNFLLWQISYAELLMSQIYWPDFSPNHLLEAIVEYQARQKRKGK